MGFPEPARYEFSEADRERYAERFFRMSPELIHSGSFAELWRVAGRRGGGVATSMLPVLALETWPLKKQDRAQIDGTLGLAPSSPGWTPWASASHRRIAAVAGISTSSVRVGLRILSKQGLIEFATVQHAASLGRKRTYYRLAASIFAPQRARAAVIAGDLLYGGHWSMLPTNASRHLFLILAALDPVIDASQLAGAIGDEQVETLREKHCYSWGTLQQLSGLSHSTFVEAIGVLTRDIPSGSSRPYLPYFHRGGEGPHYYARNRVTWHWMPAFLNKPRNDRQRSQDGTWPEVAERLKAEQRRRRTLARKRRQPNVQVA